MSSIGRATIVIYNSNSWHDVMMMMMMMISRRELIRGMRTVMMMKRLIFMILIPRYVLPLIEGLVFGRELYMYFPFFNLVRLMTTSDLSFIHESPYTFMTPVRLVSIRELYMYFPFLNLVRLMTIYDLSCIHENPYTFMTFFSSSSFFCDHGLH